MYRQPDQRASTPPVVLRYRTYLTRIRIPLIATLLFVISLVCIGCIHATHLTCTKTPVVAQPEQGQPSTQCSSNSYSAFSTHSRTVTINPGDDLNVRIERGSKGSKWAIVTLRTKAFGDIAIGEGFLQAGRFDPEVAYAAATDFERFQKTDAATTFDFWLRESIFSMGFMVVIGGVLTAIAIAMLRETILQRRWITIVVDHDRRIVTIGGQDVGFDEIRMVGVDTGKALFWASGKNEYIPGYRVFVELMDDIRVFATKDYRAGPGNTAEHAHEAIKTKLAREIGLHLRDHAAHGGQGKPIGVADGSARRKRKKRR